MDKVVISGISAVLDGEYEVSWSDFTNRELHTIKQMSGVRAGELEEALEAGDSDLLLAVAVIAMQRSGRYVKGSEDALWDSAPGKITFEFGEDEEEVPPTSPPRGGARESSSGKSSSGAGELHPESAPNGTGSPDSVTGSDFVPVT